MGIKDQIELPTQLSGHCPAGGDGPAQPRRAVRPAVGPGRAVTLPLHECRNEEGCSECVQLLSGYLEC